MILLNGAQSRELDRLSRQKYGIPSYTLMTRAGEAVADETLRRWPDAAAHGVLVAAGKGNNGGDGLVAARRLIQRGARVEVLLLASAEELRGDAARAHAELIAAGGKIAALQSEAALEAHFKKNFAVAIDAIFGTGLNAEVRGLARRAIETINASGKPVVAVDIASGVHSDTGAILGVAARASLTVTFGAAKYGHVTFPGARFCGALEIADIGFAPQAFSELGLTGRFLEAADVRDLVLPRAPDSHKGAYGHTLVVAGSVGKSGAALLAARGALRAGAGLVTAAVPDAALPMVAAGQAELMTEPMPSSDGHFSATGTIKRLGDLIEGKNALVAGPGIGTSADSEAVIMWLVSEACAAGRPLVLDADGLNVLARRGCEAVRSTKGPVVMTPHPGEMARLLGASPAQVNADRISAARQLSDRTGAWVALKGARTIVTAPDGAVHVNSSGNPGMATGGMGDVLSGILGAFLSQKIEPLNALALGVFLHGYAADSLATRLGPVGYLASEVAQELVPAMGRLAAQGPAPG